MKRCLDEGTLQSYFDGELPIEMMESATVHLSSCVTCAAMAREFEQETALLTSALAAEFDAPVPTEQLRRRVDAAVADVSVPVVAEKRSFFGSLTSFFNVAPQQAFGYAGLILVLAFAAIFGVMKMRSVQPTNQPSSSSQVASNQTAPAVNPTATTGAVNTPANNGSEIPKVNVPDDAVRKPQRVVYKPAPAARVAPKGPAPVKLFPGERAYLQTIAKLDSTIKAQKSMRPALQVEYERNLAVVDRAIAATRTAAKNNPNNPDAADFMFAAYQSKVDLLNTIADARVGGRSH
jgi:Predicted transmembrane transcriptional regulator (anti-sigma factor)